MRKVSVYGVPHFSDPKIARAVEAVGGWRYVCLSPESTLHTTRARFLEAYSILIERERRQARMLPEVQEMVRRLAEGKSLRGLLAAGAESIQDAVLGPSPFPIGELVNNENP